MKKQTDEGNLTELLDSEQLERQDNLNDSVVRKIGKTLKKLKKKITGHEQKC